MPRGRSAHYSDQRELILAQAAALFAERGYAATSMNQLAEASGLSKATLYHYYRDKYALLREIALGHVRKLEALVQQVEADARRDGLGPEALLRLLVLRFVEEYAGAQDAHRVLTVDVRFLEPQDHAEVQTLERRVVLGLAQAVGAVRPELAAAALAKPLTMLLFGMINWMFTWMRPEGRFSHAEMAPVVADLFLAGLLGVRAPAAPDLPPGLGLARSSPAAAGPLPN